MTTFLLIRHGMTDAIGRFMAGRTPGISLNREGREQVTRLAEFLADVPLLRIYSSPLERAEQTARTVAAPHRFDVEIREAFNEVDFGAWTERSFAELDELPEFRAFNAHRAGHAPPSGEHPARVQERIVAELCRLRDQHADAVIAVVGHADPFKYAIAFFTGAPIDLFRRFELSPASVTGLELSPGDARLLFANHSAGRLPLGT